MKLKKKIKITVSGFGEVEIDKEHHAMLPRIISMLGAGVNVFLVGEAGTGKTHLVEQAAQILKKEFYCMSVCYQSSASQLLGYMNAAGEYVPSLFRRAYEHGGVFLLDEVDNGNANVLSVMNSALSNKYCAFPDKMVAKHENFILCASGNTFGTGADRKYAGRLEIDGATLDRFVTVEILYDPKLEEKICGSSNFAKMIQAARSVMQSKGGRHIISPRASINGVKLVKAFNKTKDDFEKILTYTLWKNMDKLDKGSIEDNEDFKKWKTETLIEFGIIKPPKKEKTKVEFYDDKKSTESEKPKDTMDTILDWSF